MKTHYKSILILMLLSCSWTFITSCNKSDNHSWEGRVLEYGSNKPIANATVYLVEKSSSGILGPVGSSTVDSITTGSDGKFKFRFIDGPVAHYIRGKAELYYETELSRNGNSPSKTKKDLILDPHAWLRIHVKNVNPVDSNDYLSLGSNTWPKCSKGFRGEVIDTFIICDYFRGNKEANYRYRIAKSNVGWMDKGVKVLLGSKDTTDVHIEY